MTSFSNNFSKVLLLANENIVFKNGQGEWFELVPMKVKDFYTNESLIWFLSFLDSEVEDIQKYLSGIKIESHYQFILTVLTLAEKQEEVRETADYFLEALNHIVPGFSFRNKQLKIHSITVNEELFNTIVEILYKIMNKKEKIKIVDGDDEMTQKMKAMQKKIQEIKTKGKKMNEDSTDFESMFVALLYEFPQYKLEDLFELNIYTFYYLFKYVGKIANYEVSKIAAGNGLAKKHKYFIEK
jgi:hypothetical protein